MTGLVRLGPGAERGCYLVRELPPEVPVVLSGLKIAPQANIEVIVRVEVVGASDVEARLILDVDIVCRLVEDFAAQSEAVGNLALEQPTEEPIVLVAQVCVLIDRIPSATIRGPVAEAFLQPNWQEDADMACTEISWAASGWKIYLGIDADLRAQWGLIDETIFKAQVGVTEAVVIAGISGSASGCLAANRQLAVGDKPVV